MHAIALETLPDALRPFEDPLTGESAGSVQAHLDRLRVALCRLRLQSPDASWAAFTAKLRQHPVWIFVQQDPMVRRSAEKPRGYPGDAVLMDYIYRAPESWPEVDALPEQALLVHQFTTNLPVARAMRYRRKFAARIIDELAVSGKMTRVVSIASGHLREAELSDAAQAGTTEFVAIDQDPECLATIRRTMGSIKVETIEGSVRQILTGELRIPDADLVYAPGLFDYLPQPAAQRLTALMLQAVRPGGVLLIPNFRPGITDVGWMESFMDWKLIYRRDTEMLDLLGDWTRVSRAAIHRDPDNNISFLKVYRPS